MAAGVEAAGAEAAGAAEAKAKAAAAAARQVRELDEQLWQAQQVAAAAKAQIDEARQGYLALGGEVRTAAL